MEIIALFSVLGNAALLIVILNVWRWGVSNKRSQEFYCEQYDRARENYRKESRENDASRGRVVIARRDAEDALSRVIGLLSGGMDREAVAEWLKKYHPEKARRFYVMKFEPEAESAPSQKKAAR